MRRILNNEETNAPINIWDVKENEPVFAKQNERLVGMIVKEVDGWILRLGGSSGSSGFFLTFKECFDDALPRGYEFYVDR